MRIVICAALAACILMIVASPHSHVLPTALRIKRANANSPDYPGVLALVDTLRSAVLPLRIDLVPLCEVLFHPSLPARLATVCERLC